MKERRLVAPIIIEDRTLKIVKVILKHAPLAEPDLLILDYLMTNNEICNKIARQITGIGSENKVKRIFNKLIDIGKIERVPGKNGNKAAYQIKRV
jgi:ATP-dependent DNA helicase RecG